MKIVKTKIKDLVIIKTNIFKDVEKHKILKKKFIFDCFSFSKKNTLRGLHLQRRKSQAKIITVVHGQILDVVVDLRKNSKTYGKYFSIKLSHDSDCSIYIPPSFAHGFLCLSKNCAVYYKCTNYRDKNSEQTIKWNDETLKIKWPKKRFNISNKDKKMISFKEFCKTQKFL